MKLSLFLFVACALFAGQAIAQPSCSVKALNFPDPGDTPVIFNSAVCIASGTPGGTQTARLRWDNNNAGELQLFDTDDAGAPLLWCAADSSGNCVHGKSLCLQQDGNLVIYPDTNCGGRAVWASNTAGTNEGGESLFVAELVLNGVPFGESAFIFNDTNAGADEAPQLVWFSNAND